MTTKSTIPTTPEAAPEKKAKNEDVAAWGQQPHAHTHVIQLQRSGSRK